MSRLQQPANSSPEDNLTFIDKIMDNMSKIITLLL